MRKSIIIATFVVLSLASSARAAELDKFLEAREAGDWGAAERAWRALDASEPRTTDLVLKHVDVLIHLDERAEAGRVVADVLAKEPRNVVALATLARLRVRESADAAKELLLDAAREGYPVLREIRGSKELAALHDDPSFVLAAMRASSQFDARLERTRNPFTTPRPSSEPTVREPRIVRPTAKEPARRLEDYIRQGNELLRRMARDLRDEKLAEVSFTLVDVKALCDVMEKEHDLDFTRNADAIWIRATALDAEAKKLLRVKELGIVVTGVVVAPSIKSRAIVAVGGKDAGRIYEVGEELRDPSGERVRGLKVARIDEGLVGFDYEGTAFVRELRHGP